MRILLLEDNPADADFLQELLIEADKADWNLTHVEYLAAALEQIQQLPFDIALSDLSLPDAQGLDAVSEIHAIAPSLPIVVLTGSQDEATGLIALREGAQDYLSKGEVDRDSLTRAIRYAIERSQAQQVMHQQAAAMSSCADGIAILNHVGEFTYLNQACAAIHGYSDPTELLGKTWRVLYDEPDAAYLAQTAFSALAQHGSWTGEMIGKRHNGEKFYQELLLTALGQGSAVCTIRDVTSRKLIEADRLQLLAQERQARTEAEAAQALVTNILESISDAFLTLDHDWRFTYLNQRAEQLLQRSKRELIGKNVWQEFPEAANLPFYSQYHYAVAAQKSVEFEEFYPPLNTWFAVHAYPVQEGLTVYFQDINRRKQAEAHLTRIRKAVESASDAISITDLSGELIYQNQAFINLYGYTLDEVNQLGGLTNLVIQPEMREHVSAAVQACCSWSGEVEIKAKDDRIVATLFRADCIFDEDGNRLGLIKVCTDISGRKQTEEEVRLLQTMTQAIFESEDFHSALAVALQKVGEATAWNFGEAWIPRSDGSVLECSPAWYCSTPELASFRELSEQLTFAPRVGIPGRVWISKKPEWRQDVSQESTQIYQRTEAAKQAGLKAALGIPILASKTVLAVLVFYMFESKNEDARLIELISASTQLGLAIQRKRAEEEVRQALEKERELNDLKSRIVSRTSHEFRTPLTIISTSAGLLKNYSHKWTEDKKAQHFQRIQTAIDRITHLLDDVLFLEKGEARKQEFQPSDVELEAFCRDLVEELQLSIGVHHSILFTCEGSCMTAYVDKKLLHLILSNLLSNAVKYSPQASSICLHLDCCRDQVTFRVKDSGIGIPPEALPQLFESFYRAKNVGNISGTGLGLAIVKQSVDLHQGTIEVSSQIGVGTTFTVILPVVSSNQLILTS